MADQVFTRKSIVCRQEQHEASLEEDSFAVILDSSQSEDDGMGRGYNLTNYIESDFIEK